MHIIWANDPDHSDHLDHLDHLYEPKHLNHPDYPDHPDRAPEHLSWTTWCNKVDENDNLQKSYSEKQFAKKSCPEQQLVIFVKKLSRKTVC